MTGAIDPVEFARPKAACGAEVASIGHDVNRRLAQRPQHLSDSLGFREGEVGQCEGFTICHRGARGPRLLVLIVLNEIDQAKIED